MASMTAAGAIGEQASDVFRGKDPRDMTDPRFWASAVARGGSLGPMGDFLYSSTSRHGAMLHEALLGPVLAGELGQGVRLTVGNVRDLIQKGEAENVGYEAVQFAKGLLPGNSLWYLRAAVDRMMADGLTVWVDGGDAARRFRCVERQAAREFGQRYWWRPGHALPSRAPEPSNSTGK